ncbi:hypothetical protein Pint_19464 [Pistacia integerrima]|uniref:Uncharacterized protein n=1 Tax=Pistacia integerrima TaxID=434235 RepID=A0ACC0YZZ6_9ROSI|nr:hypothetical protein Pint_19464 [Pistacia integerrima]
MEKMGDLVGSRQSDLNKSFKLAIRSLLTTCSKEEFSKAFNNFTASEQDSLHRLFIQFQVITSLHENIEDEFQSLCLETQVGNTLDTVEQLVEEKGLDPLSSDKFRMIILLMETLWILETLQPFPWTWSEQSTSCAYQLYVHILI